MADSKRGRTLIPGPGFGRALDTLIGEKRRPNGARWRPADLAAELGMSGKQVRTWIKSGKGPEDPVILARIGEVFGVDPFRLLNGEIHRIYPAVAGLSVAASATVSTESRGPQTGTSEDVEEIAQDPDYAPEGSGLQFGGTDLTFEEVLQLILYNREGFTRHLQTRFTAGRVRLPVASKLGFLDHVERIAKEHGVTIPRDFLESLRALIRTGGL